MSNIEKIRQEIDRLLGNLEQDPHLPDEDKEVDEGVKNVLEHLKGFIKRQKEGWIDVRDSLPDEGDFADFSKIVSEDLEEAAEEHIRKVADAVRRRGWDLETQDIADAFGAGAEWQKEQMMKDAVEGKVFMSFAPGHNQMVMADVDLPVNTKVKLIIIKEDKED